MDELNNIELVSNNVWIAEDESDPDALIVKFIICDFGRNKNGVAIDRASAPNWIATLINNPVVGKINVNIDGDEDFTSHNMRVESYKDKEDEDKVKRCVVFDTEAYGTFIDAAIETIDGSEYITAKARVWKRFPKACEIIQKRIEEGTLSTSWEVVVEESNQSIVDGVMSSVITKGRFIGHCLLSKYVEPAYDSSGVLSVADKASIENIADANKTLVSAYIDDISSLENGEKSSEGDTTTSQSQQQNDEEPNTSENQEDIKTSSLTTEDISTQLWKLLREKYRKTDNNGYGYIVYIFPEEHYVIYKLYEDNDTKCHKHTYTVDNDVVSIDDGVEVEIKFDVLTLQSEYKKLCSSEQEKNEAIIKLNEEISSLNDNIQKLTEENASLSEFKSKIEAEEATKKHETEVAEITQYALNSGYIDSNEISESEEISKIISEVDYVSLKGIIADRVVASTQKSDKSKKDNIQVSEKSPETIKVSIEGSSEDDDKSSRDYRYIINKYLGR